MGKKEKDSGFDKTSIQVTGGTAALGTTATLLIDQVVTLEFSPGSTSGAATPGVGITSGSTLQPYVNAVVAAGSNNYQYAALCEPLYVSYTNRAAEFVGGGQTAFAADQYGVYTSYSRIGSGAASLRGESDPGASAIGDRSSLTGGVYIGKRNVDKFYEIVDESLTNPFGASIENNSSEFRFKRINSEFVLVDYNITVKVTNTPVVAGTAIQHYIDGGSPRYVQSMRFAYYPDESSLNIVKALFGGGPNFNNWSMYRNWYSGAAVVGPTAGQLYTTAPGLVDEYETKLNPAWDMSSFMYDQSLSSSYGRHWNGKVFGGGGMWDQSNVFWENGVAIQGSSSQSLQGVTGSDVYPRFSNAPGAMANIFNWSYGYTGGTPSTPANFNKFISSNIFRKLSFAAFGNSAFDRNRPTQWRMVPAYVPKSGTTQDSTTTYNANSFYLEVMMDTPIMHCDHIFRSRLFNGTDNDIQPYQCLTLSGQAIMRYNENATVYPSDYTTLP
jgi:hypothetical protein